MSDTDDKNRLKWGNIAVDIPPARIGKELSIKDVENPGWGLGANINGWSAANLS